MTPEIAEKISNDEINEGTVSQIVMESNQSNSDSSNDEYETHNSSSNENEIACTENCLVNEDEADHEVVATDPLQENELITSHNEAGVDDELAIQAAIEAARISLQQGNRKNSDFNTLFMTDNHLDNTSDFDDAIPENEVSAEEDEKECFVMTDGVADNVSQHSETVPCHESPQPEENFSQISNHEEGSLSDKDSEFNPCEDDSLDDEQGEVKTSNPQETLSQLNDDASEVTIQSISEESQYDTAASSESEAADVAGNEEEDVQDDQPPVPPLALNSEGDRPDEDTATVGGISHFAVDGDDAGNMEDFPDDQSTSSSPTCSRNKSEITPSIASSWSDLTENTDDLCDPEILKRIMNRISSVVDSEDNFFETLFGVKLRKRRGRMMRENDIKSISSIEEMISPRKSIGTQMPSPPPSIEVKTENTEPKQIGKLVLPSWPLHDYFKNAGFEFDELDEMAIRACIEAQWERKKNSSIEDINLTYELDKLKKEKKQPTLDDDEVVVEENAEGELLVYVVDKSEAVNQKERKDMKKPSLDDDIVLVEEGPDGELQISVIDKSEEDKRSIPSPASNKEELNSSERDSIDGESHSPECTDPPVTARRASQKQQGEGINRWQDSIELGRSEEEHQQDVLSSIRLQSTTRPDSPCSSTSTRSSGSFPRFVRSVFSPDPDSFITTHESYDCGDSTTVESCFLNSDRASLYTDDASCKSSLRADSPPVLIPDSFDVTTESIMVCTPRNVGEEDNVYGSKLSSGSEETVKHITNQDDASYDADSSATDSSSEHTTSTSLPPDELRRELLLYAASEASETSTTATLT